MWTQWSANKETKFNSVDTTALTNDLKSRIEKTQYNKWYIRLVYCLFLDNPLSLIWGMLELRFDKLDLTGNNFKWNLCDYATSSKQGLSIHIKRAHQKIIWIDGIQQLLEEDKETKTEESTEEVSTQKMVCDGTDFIEVKLRPPKYA